jgi:hypothetical protein
MQRAALDPFFHNRLAKVPCVGSLQSLGRHFLVYNFGISMI